MKLSMANRGKVYSFTKMCLLIGCFLGFNSLLLAANGEPNNIVGSCYSTSTALDLANACPSWTTALDRNSTDDSTTEHLIIELDGCRVMGYDVYTMQQGAPTGFLANLEPDDLFIVWDEDPGHGSSQDFTFTGSYVVADTNTNCNYARVSTTNDELINWVLYKVTSSGTLTVNETGFNEHDAIHLHLNTVNFTKVDDVVDNDCRSPEQSITYTICWDNAFGQIHPNSYIVDWLPEGVTYPQGSYTVDPNFVLIPPDPGYDKNTHTYTWSLGSIDPNMSGCVQLTVVVNDKAQPGRYLHNVAEFVSGEDVIAVAYEDTLVCCWDTNGILYVDQNATGNNTGVSWVNAYTDLQDALARARETQCASNYVIYAAQGTYSPGNNEDNKYELPDMIAVYGGFPTGGSDFSRRDPKRYPTILSGRISDTKRNVTIVKMGGESLLDGFTITGAANPEGPSYGVYGSGADFTLANCVVENNDDYGIRAINGNVTLEFCDIRGNKSDGIRHSGAGYTLSIHNCWIKKQMQSGVFCQNSTPFIFNSIVSESDLAEAGSAGVFAYNPTASPVLYNCTFAHNRNIGVAFTDDRTLSDPNDKDYPDVQNCILWYNNAGNDQFAGFQKDRIQYSCIYDPNNPQGSLIPDVNYNISANPQFAYIDPNNVRIAYASPCKDAGNPYLSYDDQVDMDDRIRVADLVVDIGAYEVVCEDTSNAWDWNADGLVNLAEFNAFARVWRAHDPADPALYDPNYPEHEYLTDPNGPGIVTTTSVALWYPDGHTLNYSTVGLSQYAIDLADLMVWIEDSPWLWTACWKTDIYPTESSQPAMRISGLAESEVVLTQSVAEKTIQEQAVELASTIAQLEALWLENPDLRQEINPDDWSRFMESVVQDLSDLQTNAVQKEYLDLKSL